MVSRRHFCARVQRGRGEAKKQNLRKGHLQARRAVLMPVSVLIFPRSKTSHSAPQSARHDIKHPGPLRQEQAGALSFVPGQGEDGATVFVSVPLGAGAAFALDGLQLDGGPPAGSAQSHHTGQIH